MTESEGDEFLYVLVNQSLPGMVKIGRTDRSVEDRVRELSAHSGVPTEFTVFREFRVSDSVSAERAVHIRLREYRVAENREFFAIDPETAVEVIEAMVGSVRRPAFDSAREDDLLAQATTLAQPYGKVWPSLIASTLRLSHAEAEDVIGKLRGRGILDAFGKLTFAPKRRMAERQSHSGFDYTRAIDSHSAPKAEFNIVNPEKTKITLPQSDDVNYQFPPLSVLREQSHSTAGNIEAEIRANHENLLRILGEFIIEVTLGEIHIGPVITRYEFVPAAGMRVEKVLELERSIVQRVNLRGVRVIASLPGRSTIGIEVPNKNPTPVGFRSVLESEDWAVAKAELPIALGREVSGKPLLSDLTKMPHLLIAGATGSGKSVCINAIIASILYSRSPKDVRLVMIDPRVVDLKIFNSLPHMLIPVVSNPEKAPGVLMWLLGEMQQRYEMFAKQNVRNIIGFNSRKKDSRLEPHSHTGFDPLADDIEIPDRLPYIVVVINELADLVMVARQEVETGIVRLAQHAGAAGIHLVLATQRISENVITDEIKANLPSHISFQVKSPLDSRIILGTKGAETLVGRGDMLVSPPGTSQLIRAQCAWVLDDEIQQVVEFLKRNGPPVYARWIQTQIDRAAKEADEEENGAQDDVDLGDDSELYAQAVDVLKSTRRASTAMLQRRLRIGYNRAARIMELMEEKGIVGPENGSSPREILVDLDML